MIAVIQNEYVALIIVDSSVRGRDTVFRFEDNGTAFTDLGSVSLDSVSIDADALALSQSGNLLGYQVGGGSSTLISINPATAVATKIGSTLKHYCCKASIVPVQHSTKLFLSQMARVSVN